MSPSSQCQILLQLIEFDLSKRLLIWPSSQYLEIAEQLANVKKYWRKNKTQKKLSCFRGAIIK